MNFNNSIFVFRDVYPLTITTIQNGKNLDYKNTCVIKIHDFRHSCASLLINQGINITSDTKILRIFR